MKNFYNQIIGSIYNPKFYKDLDHKNTSYTIAYLFKLAGTIAIVTTLVIAIMLCALESKLLKNADVTDVGSLAIVYVEQNYPEDLIITFKDNMLSTNSSGPVIFPIPYEWFDNGQAEDDLTNAVVIVPTENYSNSLLETYDTAVVLASSTAGIMNNDSVKTIDYTEVDEEYDDIVIDKDLAMKKAGEAADYINTAMIFIWLFGILAIFFGSLIVIVVGAFIFALFTGLIIYVLARFEKLDGNYGSWYLKAIHADTLFIILSWTVGWIYSLSSIPFANTFIVLLVLLVNNEFMKK